MCKFNGEPSSIKATPDGRTYLPSKLDHYIQREKTTILNKTRQLIAVICAPFWQLMELHYARLVALNIHLKGKLYNYGRLSIFLT
jgi:hypothetical protein